MIKIEQASLELTNMRPNHIIFPVKLLFIKYNRVKIKLGVKVGPILYI